LITREKKRLLMGLLPVGVCVIGLISVYMLGRSLRQLQPYREAIVHLVGERRIRILLNVLLAGPVIAAAGLPFLYVTVYRDDFLLRIAHGAMISGLWYVLALAFIILVLVTRLGYRPTLSTLVSPVLAVPLVAYLTPLERFEEVFSTTPLSIPLMVGLVLLISCMLYVYLAKKELLR
jgi:hypothetical protein